MTKWLINSWYKPHPVRWLLLPLSYVYQAVIALRKALYDVGLMRQSRLAVPVIIIGNITVGGTGKTPAVIWLAQKLQQAGFKPGIISRGYGGHALCYPVDVKPNSNPDIVGDEPVVISRQTGCPVGVSPHRAKAGKMLLKRYDCDVIIADDGLQHLALARDINIAIVDGGRLFGNQLCLPAGPLREPLSRLQTLDFIIYNQGSDYHPFKMTVTQKVAINLADETISKDIADFNLQPIHAIAGVGNPDHFFSQLEQQDLTVMRHSFADHYRYQQEDVIFADDFPVLMTEKDAVKCRLFATKNMWYVPISGEIDGKLDTLLIEKIKALL